MTYLFGTKSLLSLFIYCKSVKCKVGRRGGFSWYWDLMIDIFLCSIVHWLYKDNLLGGVTIVAHLHNLERVKFIFEHRNDFHPFNALWIGESKSSIAHLKLDRFELQSSNEHNAIIMSSIFNNNKALQTLKNISLSFLGNFEWLFQRK
jgi:hypothetical protein